MKSSSTFLLGATLANYPEIGFDEMVKGRYPQKLNKGDKVGVVTPGSALSAEGFEEALSNIRALGLDPVPATYANQKYGFLGGTDFQRLADLHEMFGRKDIRGIICARGGYGTGRLLPHLDFKLIRQNPKAVIGFSDITALLNTICKETGLVCFHGPVGASKLTDFTKASLEEMLMGNREFVLKEEGGYTLQSGVATGRLVGGNLSLINSLLGTPYEIKLKNRIVMIEEVGESPYRIDRMLTQLIQSGDLAKSKGIVFGNFSGCDVDPEDPEYESSFKLKDVLTERCSALNLPCYYGFPFGHVDDNATLPIGGHVTFDATNGTLSGI